MAFTVFVDGAKLCLEFSWNFVAVTTCLHFKHPAPDAAAYQALADQGGLSWGGQMLIHASSDLVMGEVTVYDLSEEFAPKYVNLTQVGLPGTDGADSVPNNTAVLISHRTAHTGRSGRGRNYLPGLSEVQEGDGLLLATKRDAILISWATMMTNILPTGWVFQVAQRYEDGLQLETGIMREVTTEILRLELGTQRRRQVRSAL